MPAQGGNGASTVAVHVADAIRRELLRQSKLSRHPAGKPLLADFDFHAGTLPFRLRLEPRFTLADAAKRADVIGELWTKIACDWNGVAVLAPPPAGAKLAPKAIERLAALFTSATRVFPYVLVDLPTALYASCRDLLISADGVYLVSTPEVMALHLARRRVAELQELGRHSDSIRLVLNRVGARRSIKSDDAAEVAGVPVVAEIQNNYDAFSDACAKGAVVPPRSRPGRQIEALAHSIMGVREASEGKPAPKRWRTFLAFD
jgi:Flp pilus assembly CpaE family ATPase